jgi:hypothetical protein
MKTALKLEFHRRRLNEMAGRLGWNHPLVLAQSRRVDRLVMEIQRGK